MHTDKAVIAHYADLVSEDKKFPPLDVFKHDDCYFLADGKHRLEAARPLTFNRSSVRSERDPKRLVTTAKRS